MGGVTESDVRIEREVVAPPDDGSDGEVEDEEPSTTRPR